MIGYPPHQKGYKLYDIDNKKIFISRDVVFHESILPFVLNKNKRDYIDLMGNKTSVTYDEENEEDTLEETALDINPREPADTHNDISEVPVTQERHTEQLMMGMT